MRAKLPVWQVIERMRRGTIRKFDHDHAIASRGRKCRMHQTLVANAKAYGLTIHVFHDNHEGLWVARLPE